jgi:hypothetical protein
MTQETDTPQLGEEFISTFHEAMTSAAGTDATFKGESLELMKMSAKTCLMDIPGEQVQITFARMMAMLATLKGRTIKGLKYDFTPDDALNPRGEIGTFSILLEPENIILPA